MQTAEEGKTLCPSPATPPTTSAKGLCPTPRCPQQSPQAERGGTQGISGTPKGWIPGKSEQQASWEVFLLPPSRQASPLLWTLGEDGALWASPEMLTGPLWEVLTRSPEQQAGARPRGQLIASAPSVAAVGVLGETEAGLPAQAGHLNLVYGAQGLRQSLWRDLIPPLEGDEARHKWPRSKAEGEKSIPRVDPEFGNLLKYLHSLHQSPSNPQIL